MNYYCFRLKHANITLFCEIIKIEACKYWRKKPVAARGHMNGRGPRSGRDEDRRSEGFCANTYRQTLKQLGGNL